MGMRARRLAGVVWLVTGGIATAQTSQGLVEAGRASG